MLTDVEKRVIFKLFWPRGYVQWSTSDHGYLRAIWTSGSEATVIQDSDPVQFALRKAAAEAFALELQDGMIRLLTGNSR